MREIVEGFRTAVELLLSFDKEIYDIILLSIYVSLVSTFLSTIIAVPIGIIIGAKDFPLKRLVVRFIYTMMSLPPVIVGLVVFLFISRRGPFGYLGIVFTPTAMIVAQIFLIAPIVAGIVYNGTKEKGEEIKKLAKTLGANRRSTLILLIKELRIIIFTGIVSGYGRAISEVGAVMVVGGNIKGHTRVMTTTIAMLRNQGDYATAIAIGLVLLFLSFIINSTLYHFQQGE
ncbi:carbohydrate ABC transporter ATP-binding protein, CUT1 family [Clostridium aceticum]|uniref:Carbohydrate ABC transporter ATP-binding protein, CUT1 family n=1 Tax=Clostridium aceticum TaxID=84022 RepID=A0A0G3W8Z1_9CLOT|nr:ABC transporter permease [Clostridium aceticum]AKL94377.1 carbohydrate ABC transporter ATP-binding protein, CUT1 family [Clostridium aceticum]